MSDRHRCRGDCFCYVNGDRDLETLNLETLSTEYTHIRAEVEQQRKMLQAAQRALSDKGSELIEAIIEAGLTEYGPIKSTLEHHLSGEMRRLWTS